MPAERRSLRSNKPDSSSHPDSQKPRSDSSGSNSKKDKSAPSRSTSSRIKPSSKKGVTTLAEDMAGDKPRVNGNDSAENGVNGTEDVEIEEEKSRSSKSTKSGKDKDVDEEMTVIVPPSKTNKLPSAPHKDNEGDLVMNGAGDDGATTATESDADPKAKAIASEFFLVTVMVASPNVQILTILN
jgi:26S proteasome regulatory subunit N3